MTHRPPRFLIFTVFAGLAVTTGCHPSTVPPPTPALVTVATVEAAGTHSGRSSRFSGTVRPYRQVDVAFRVSGYVESLLMLPDATGRRPLQAGDRLMAGTVLARIQSTDYQAHVDAVRATVSAARATVDVARSKQSETVGAVAAAQAALGEAKAGLGEAQAQRDEASAGVHVASSTIADAEANAAVAKSTLDRVAGLYHSASATRPEFDAAKANYDSASAKLLEARGALDAARERVSESSAGIDAARARILAASANVASSKSASVEAGNAIVAAKAQVAQVRASEAAQEVSVGDTSLRAPISGTILVRRVDIGSLVGPGTPAFTIADTSRMKVVFGIPESSAARLRVGQRVDLTVGASRAVEFTGVISNIPPAADDHTGVYDIEVTIANTDGRVKAGMLSTLSTEGTDASDTVEAPISAVVQSHDNPNGYAVVMVSSAGGRTSVHYRDVQLGASHGDSIEVHGVQPGDIVVTSGPALLHDGEVVEVTHSGSDAQ